MKRFHFTAPFNHLRTSQTGWASHEGSSAGSQEIGPQLLEESGHSLGSKSIGSECRRDSFFKNSLRTPGHPMRRQCLKSWDAPFEFPESPDFNNSQDRSSACGFPVEFEMFVISFSYLIPGGGPGKTEA